MRRLTLLTIALILLIGLVVWLVLPMFVPPSAMRLDNCRTCEALLRRVPPDAERVIIVPRGGTTLFELARRIDPGPEITNVLPAPGLLAIGLGNAPLVAWVDSESRLGAAAATNGPRSLLARAAAYKYGGRGLSWSDGILFLGDSSSAGDASFADFGHLRNEEGHFFAVHDLWITQSMARSVGVLDEGTLDIETFIDEPTEPAEVIDELQHPADSIVSIAVANLSVLLGPIERILPVRIGNWGGAGQIVVYGFEAKGLLPRVRGIVFVESDDDPAVAIDRLFPSIDGATRDTARVSGDVQVVRRETLGVVVETARSGEKLAIALDGTSIDRWIRGETRPVGSEAVWSLEGDPGKIDSALAELRKSPGRYALSRSGQRQLARLQAVIGPLRTASRVSSSLVPRFDSHVIVTRVTW